jgi:hypothetical protein
LNRDCGKSCGVSSSLLSHRKTNEKKMKMVCILCEKAFGTQRELTLHTRKFCKKGYHLPKRSLKRPFICREFECRKKFAWKGGLSRHKKLHLGPT